MKTLFLFNLENYLSFSISIKLWDQRLVLLTNDFTQFRVIKKEFHFTQGLIIPRQGSDKLVTDFHEQRMYPVPISDVTIILEWLQLFFIVL